MATGDAHKNFAYSTIASGALLGSTSATTFTVAAGTGSAFPAVPFNATIWPASVRPTSTNAEVVRVTGRSIDVFTVVRAQESSTAGTFSANCQIAATITTKALTDIETAIDAIYQAVAGAGVTLTNDTFALTTTFASRGLKVDVLTTTGAGTWTKPTNSVWHDILCISGGTGGGSGQKVANNTTNAWGGSGGGSGGVSRGRFPSSAFAATEDYVVGAGGAGGAAQTSVANGNNGTLGANTTFGTDLNIFANVGTPTSGGLAAGSGIGGTSGTGSETPAGMVAAPKGGTYVVSGRKGGNGAGGGVAGTAGAVDGRGPGAGGGGGGLTGSGSTLVAASNGGDGTAGHGAFSAWSIGGTVANATAGTAGVAGADASVQDLGGLYVGGGGGSGGNGSNLSGTAGGAGGAGGKFGGSGGGGGNGCNADSGAGGAGAQGVLVIVSFIGTGA